MKRKIINIRIRTQLLLGFAVILLFVIALGMTAYIQKDQLFDQTETLYSHPLKVRIAIGDLNSDILTMRLGQRNLMLAANGQQQQAAIQMMSLASADAQKQFGTIEEWYLGPTADVRKANQAFLLWNIAREENITLALSGNIEQVKENVLDEGKVGSYREIMLSNIKVIDDFALNKGDEIYKNAVDLKNSLNSQMFLLISVILILSAVISYIILQNIRNPLKEMSNAVARFHNGDMSVRSTYVSKNEFGVLSSSINSLAENVQKNTMLNKNTVALAEVMLREDDAVKFFRTTLGALTDLTGSQIAAVYLLNTEKNIYEHFESIGMEENAKQSFAADSFEGEFGKVLISRKIQYITNIPADSRYLLQTVNNRILPGEIITIPVLSGKQVIAVISLAAVSSFTPDSIELIEHSIIALSARIEGILAYTKIKNYKAELELQNRELESHKSELSVQTAELISQNAELETQKKQLDEASRLKTIFLSNMSHELRTPLNSVIALSGVLNRRLINQIPKEEYSYLEIIERNGKNLLMLINDILDISRIEAGREEVEISRFHADNLINEIVLMIQPQAEQKNIELLHYGSLSDLYINSDADKCRHILQNLIGNAVKFTEKGRVAIAAQLVGNRIEIKVTDTGIGISEENLTKVFDEFRQADGSTSRRFGGTGLGLAIAKKYANMLGGTISVSSIPDAGSEFTLSLPLQYSDENRVPEEIAVPAYRRELSPRPASPAVGSAEKTVLLVDDNESAVIQIKDLIEELGIRVLTARDAAEAFRIIGHTMPDAMILDLMMPDIDGFKVLEMLRNSEPTALVPVLILTAKHITKEELAFLKHNNIHQLIQKGDVDRTILQKSVSDMLYPEKIEVKHPQRQVPEIVGDPRVLVVEDNPDNMITVKALLDGHYIVIEAVNASEAIELANKHVPDLILMDIALPDVNGIEAFLAIRKITKLQHIPVIALTASAMVHDRESILAYGFDAFIAKPIIAREFFKVISEVLYGK